MPEVKHAATACLRLRHDLANHSRRMKASSSTPAKTSRSQAARWLGEYGTLPTMRQQRHRDDAKTRSCARRRRLSIASRTITTARAAAVLHQTLDGGAADLRKQPRHCVARAAGRIPDEMRPASTEGLSRSRNASTAQGSGTLFGDHERDRTGRYCHTTFDA